jgi:hypothetical protein
MTMHVNFGLAFVGVAVGGVAVVDLNNVIMVGKNPT